MALTIHPAILAPAALVAAVFLGGFLRGIDRRITARLQSRKGPAVTQPYWDVVKLMGKKGALVNPWQAFCARASFGAAATAVMLFAVQANLLLIIFVYSAAGAFLVLGAMSSLSPYSQVGAQRQLWQMFCCEAVLFCLAAAIYTICGGFRVELVFAQTTPVLFRAPLLYAAFLFALTIKMQKSPFDFAGSHHAHQEIVRGVYTEYSGSHLAWIEVAHWLEVVLYLCICGLFWATGWGMIVLPVVSFLAVILLDNVSSRLTWRWMTTRGLIAALLMSFVNLCRLIW
ncbi:MAG: NADH-quinone oxidoreductase subunit H [Pseudomonadota bacterium]